MSSVYIRHSKEASEYEENKGKRSRRWGQRGDQDRSHRTLSDWIVSLNPWNLWMSLMWQKVNIISYAKNVVKDLERWSLSRIIQVVSKCNHTCPYRRDTQRRSNGKTEQRDAPQAEGTNGHQKLEDPRNAFSPGASRGRASLSASSDPWLPELREKNVCCFHH